MGRNCLKFGCATALLFSLVACTSAQIKARKEQRDKAVQTTHLYCEFVNGETYPDIDVALNLEMAKKCDSEKPMTVSNYRSPSDSIGLIFCCGTHDDSIPAATAKADLNATKDMAKELAPAKEPGASKESAAKDQQPKDAPKDAVKAH